jgi:type II secretory pathway pseudopilin PulG
MRNMLKLIMSLFSKRPLRGTRGITLIEVSVILSVLAILSAFLVPSVGHFLQDASILQAQHDVQVIASGLVNFMNDTGQSPAVLGDYLYEFQGNMTVDILAGPGRRPQINHGQLISKPRARLGIGAKGFQLMSPYGTAAWRQGKVSALENFLQVNGCALPLKKPGIGFGWNGAYINNQLNSGPWGNQYLVNVGFLDTQAGAGDAEGVARKAVFVISAGPNRVIETPFSQSVADAFVYGDDIVARIR